MLVMYLNSIFIMITCFMCVENFVNNEDFFKHVNYVHQKSKSFTCIRECGRVYKTYESFRKHFRLKHSASSNDSELTNVPEIIDTSNGFTGNVVCDGISIRNDRDSSINLVDNVTFENSSSVSDSRLLSTSIISSESPNSSITYNCNPAHSFEKPLDIGSLLMPSEVRKIDSSRGCDTANIIYDSSAIPINYNDCNAADSNSSSDFMQNANSCKTMKGNLNEETLYVAKLYSYPDVSRARVQTIFKDTSEFVDSVTSKIKVKLIESLTFEEKKNLSTKIEKVFEKNICQIEQLSTERRRIRTFEDLDTYISPQSYLLGERQDYILKNGIKTLHMVKVTAEFILLRLVLQCFFEIPGIFDETWQYMNSLYENREIISNFIQGSLWGNICSDFDEKIVLPLILYFDDYETNNPLGSHRGISKCGAIYISIPCLPPKMQAKLENIFLFVLFNTLDRSFFTNKVIFQKIVDELNFLEQSGIIINTPSGPKHLYFVLSLVIGDNLGLNQILGFTTSFNSNLFCRFCYINKKSMQNTFDEIQCNVRDAFNYETDVLKNDSKTTGILERCVFHVLKFYHVTKNLSVDVMHDLLEGVAQYDLGLFLYMFIYVYKLFSLEELNALIRGFDYGQNKNKPPEFSEEQVKKNVLLCQQQKCFVFSDIYVL